MVKKLIGLDINVVRVLLALLLFGLYYLPLNILKNLNKIWVQVILMVIIVLVCILDPISALLMAIVLILILRELNNISNETFDYAKYPIHHENTMIIKPSLYNDFEEATPPPQNNQDVNDAYSNIVLSTPYGGTESIIPVGNPDTKTFVFEDYVL